MDKERAPRTIPRGEPSVKEGGGPWVERFQDASEMSLQGDHT